MGRGIGAATARADHECPMQSKRILPKVQSCCGDTATPVVPWRGETEHGSSCDAVFKKHGEHCDLHGLASSFHWEKNSSTSAEETIGTGRHDDTTGTAVALHCGEKDSIPHQ